MKSPNIYIKQQEIYLESIYFLKLKLSFLMEQCGFTESKLFHRKIYLTRWANTPRKRRKGNLNDCQFRKSVRLISRKDAIGARKNSRDRFVRD
ncbi:hypothetical protein CEXT_336541 [Caerostris extrusa]|uniref:Uncharacterized protein n=1 Tax=Caerostris extrusa TaxID=172846 RepID=A0AAV4XCP3_CAEEX|nr:hypothetical protein CEXT_336541 [Caerostris extrusa]